MSSKVRRAEAERPSPDRQRRGRRAVDPGFDRWLNKQLHQIYDPVLSEAVPEDMMRLLEGLDEVDEPAGDDDRGSQGKSGTPGEN